MHLNSKRAITAIALTIALSACADNATAPASAAAARGASRSVTTGRGRVLHANSERYSDKGAKPATGRSGSATIQARALLAKDGTTTIEATTGTLDGGAAPGQIAKVQLKSINGAGDALTTTNFNGLKGAGYWSTTTSGLLRGAPLQVQTNITGIDAHRTDVVTVSATVVRRPDIRVTSVTNPAKAYVNSGVDIAAVLSEANGDVGATANCLLFVDGTQADQALGVWVDAGSSVSCAFHQNFTTTGTHTLEVRATNVAPADWDLSNNAATGSIEIVLPIVNLQWSSSAYWYDNGSEDDGVQSFNNCYYYYYSCSYGQTSYSNGSESQNSQFSFYAWSGEAAATFPATVAFSASTDGAALSNMSGSVGSAGSQGCVGLYDLSSNTSGTLCANGGSTSVSLTRTGGAATYHSSQYETYYNQYAYDSYCYDGFGYTYYCGTTYSTSGPYYYTYNDSYAQNNGAFALGSQITTNLVVTDASGRKFLAGGSYALQGSDYDNSYPYTYYGSYYYDYVQSGTYHSWSHQHSGYSNGFGDSQP